jgi:hypothetical protein
MTTINMRSVLPKRLRDRIACLTVVASISCCVVPFAQQHPNTSAQAPGSAGSRPNQGDQSFSAILSFAEKAVASRPVAHSRGVGGPNSNDLYTCGQVTREILPDDDLYFDVTDLAVWISLFSPQFRKEGTYEVAVPYLKRMMDYGEAQTQRVDVYLRSHKPSAKGNYPSWKWRNWEEDNETLLIQLAKALNSAVHRKEYIVDGGCGAGEILVSVKIPAGSAALLINTFHFTLCQARGTDAWNAQVCYGWKTVGKIPMMLSGAYRYVLTTVDGQKKIGDVVVNKNNGGDMDHPYVLNLK